ncbi:hypothetical protein [Sulfurimonas sp.]
MQCTALSAYLLDDSLLIFSKKSEYVYGLEKESASLFLELDLLLAKGISRKSIFDKFSKFPNDFLDMLYTLVTCKEKFKKESYSPKINIGIYKKDQNKRTTYVVNDITFSIHYPNNSIYKTIHPVIAHLSNITPTDNKISIDFMQKDEQWCLLFNQTQITDYTELSKISLLLQENMIVLVYQSKPYLIAMHAATLQYKDNLFLFPATSGSGKTTLTAVLMNNDFLVYSDELTVLDNNGKASTLPFALNIKEGSWKVLEKNYPILSTTNYHIRFDNQKVKFLKPSKNISTCKKPTHLIFPKYIKGSKTILQTLNVCNALNRIKEAGYELNEPLTKTNFEKILQYILVLPKYSLVYSSLDEAIQLIKDLTSEKN